MPESHRNFKGRYHTIAPPLQLLGNDRMSAETSSTSNLLSKANYAAVLLPLGFPLANGGAGLYNIGKKSQKIFTEDYA